MEVKKIRLQDSPVSQWNGGTTTQIAIDPPTAVYADHDFDFRVSTATIEQKESIFTVLADYDRILAPVRGQITLFLPQQSTPVVLNELEFYRFDGAWHTKSRGQATDFNLMTRKGVCTGDARSVMLSAGQRTTLPPYAPALARRSVVLLWCVEGSVHLTAGNTQMDLTAEEAVQLDSALPLDLPKLQLQESAGTVAKLLYATIHFS